jgi:hypothetical protein
MEKVVVDFHATRARVGQAEWHDLPFGIAMKLRVLVGMTAAAIEGQIAADLYAFHQGEDVLAEYGYDPADVGLLADPAIAKGWARMHTACVRGTALIEDWNLVTPQGDPVEITPANIQQLFNLGPFPGSGAVLLSAFNRIVDAPAQRIAAEKKGSPPSQNGGSAAGASTAPPVDPAETLAPMADGSTETSAPKSKTPPTPPKA